MRIKLRNLTEFNITDQYWIRYLSKCNISTIPHMSQDGWTFFFSYMIDRNIALKYTSADEAIAMAQILLNHYDVNEILSIYSGLQFSNNRLYGQVGPMLADKIAQLHG